MSEQFSPAIEAFLAKLRETPRKWRVYEANGFIRLYASCQCPMEAVAGMPAKRARSAASALGFGEVDFIRVINAADKLAGYNRRLRAALLDACGLSEPQP